MFFQAIAKPPYSNATDEDAAHGAEYAQRNPKT
jgi:hypothetical protein